MVDDETEGQLPAEEGFTFLGANLGSVPAREIDGTTLFVPPILQSSDASFIYNENKVARFPKRQILDTDRNKSLCIQLIPLRIERLSSCFVDPHGEHYNREGLTSNLPSSTSILSTKKD